MPVGVTGASGLRHFLMRSFHLLELVPKFVAPECW